MYNTKLIRCIIRNRCRTELDEMGEMFSFPHGGEPNSEEQAERALTLLREAKASESSGIALLERMFGVLEQSQTK